MIISPGSVDDVPRVAALYRACFDDRVITVAGIRHRQVSARPEDDLRFWRAEEGDELIGWSFAGRDAFAAARTTANAAIVVHPAHRRAGVGSALWEMVSAHLEAIDARRIVVYSRADEGSVAFVSARGFSLESTDTTSAVEPGPSDFSGITYDTWHRLIWGAPDSDHDLSVVATVDGVVVGTSFLYSDR